MSVLHPHCFTPSLFLQILRTFSFEFLISVLKFLFQLLSLNSDPSQTAGREERDLEGSYCTVKPGWKRRIPSDLRS